MAKDVLNKNNLSENDETILHKVLSGKNKPARYQAIFKLFDNSKISLAIHSLCAIAWIYIIRIDAARGSSVWFFIDILFLAWALYKIVDDYFKLKAGN